MGKVIKRGSKLELPLDLQAMRRLVDRVLAAFVSARATR